MPRTKKPVEKVIVQTPDSSLNVSADLLEMGGRLKELIEKTDTPYDRSFNINFWAKDSNDGFIEMIRIDNGGEGLRLTYSDGVLTCLPEYNDHIWDKNKGDWEDANTRQNGGTMKGCLEDVYKEICKFPDYFHSLENAWKELYPKPSITQIRAQKLREQLNKRRQQQGRD